MNLNFECGVLPARNSFTFVKDGQNWMVVDHRSSAMPAPPQQPRHATLRFSWEAK
jgi:hypothetical protein